MTYVCITGNESDPGALQVRIEHVLRAHSRLLCELRLDYLDLSPGALFSFLAKLPSEWAPRLVLTQRLRASGVTAQGRCGWDLPTWQSWWKDVMSLRPWFAVDLDWIVLDRLAGEGLSWQGKFSGRHAFFSLHAPLDELESLAPELASSARAHGAGVKIATPVGGASDLARLMRISSEMGEFPLKTAVAMGAAGKAWRWSPLAGSFSYFCFDETSATAPGQDSLVQVLPYLTQRRRPDLYLLWSNDPENRKGETRWNELFHLRGIHARYVNVPCSDIPKTEAEELLWAQDALVWMEKAGVKGASVTRPFKRIFAAALGEKNSAVNTLQFCDGSWSASNTDGEAVAEILSDHGLSKEPVAILGGGGAAQAVQTYLEAHGVPVDVLRRNEKGEPPPHMNTQKILISTWPGHNQQLLVEWLERCAPASLALCIDAQFSVPEPESPLADWCTRRAVRYVPGTEWWRRQALGQDRFWFDSNERWGGVRDELLAKVPRSKSITLRALAIAAIRGGKTVLHNPSICTDTLVFRKALEKMGVRIAEDDHSWIISSPAHLRAPAEVLHLGEGATGFRILLGLASQLEGPKLRLDAAPSLRDRPHDEFFSALGLAPKWPLEIALPQERQKEVSGLRSSQYGTSALIAAAAAAKRGNSVEAVKVIGEVLSEPYLQLTCKVLEAAGFKLQQEGNVWSVSLRPDFSLHWETTVEIDASAIAFLQVIAKKMFLDLHFLSDLQGDAVFGDLLERLIAGEKRISLKHQPDLAAPLVAAALLFHRDLEIFESPQLRLKETDRIHALVGLATALDVPAEEKPDGFQIFGSRFSFPQEVVTIKTFADHRIAMAGGVLGFFAPGIQVDNHECVKKSFPEFWEALQFLQKVRP